MDRCREGRCGQVTARVLIRRVGPEVGGQNHERRQRADDDRVDEDLKDADKALFGWMLDLSDTMGNRRVAETRLV